MLQRGFWCSDEPLSAGAFGLLALERRDQNPKLAAFVVNAKAKLHSLVRKLQVWGFVWVSPYSCHTRKW